MGLSGMVWTGHIIKNGWQGDLADQTEQEGREQKATRIAAEASQSGLPCPVHLTVITASVLCKAGILLSANRRSRSGAAVLRTRPQDNGRRDSGTRRRGKGCGAVIADPVSCSRSNDQAAFVAAIFSITICVSANDWCWERTFTQTITTTRQECSGGEVACV